MMTDRVVEDRLAAAFGAEMTTEQRTWVDARVHTALAPDRARRRWPRTRLARSLVLAGALLIVAPTAFAVGAAILLSEAPYGMGDATAYEAELEAAKAVTPLPPGATWPPYLEAAPDGSASYGTGLGTMMVEMNATCLWLGYWYAANDRGDAAGIAAATDALRQAREWTTFNDPLTSDEGFRASHRETIDAALAGDAATVLGQLDLNCSGTWDGDRSSRPSERDAPIGRTSVTCRRSPHVGTPHGTGIASGLRGGASSEQGFHLPGGCPPSGPAQSGRP